jgi:hypothetical protein
VHPDTAKLENLVEGKPYQVNLKGETFTLEIRLDEKAPLGTGLLPRSVGIPLNTALAVKVKLSDGN